MWLLSATQRFILQGTWRAFTQACVTVFKLERLGASCSCLVDSVSQNRDIGHEYNLVVAVGNSALRPPRNLDNVHKKGFNELQV
jgi:hypothetical protein